MKNKDTFTLWGVQDKETGKLEPIYDTRSEARYRTSKNQRTVKLECRIVPQSSKKPKTFTAYGLEWIPHTPGDPMPCEWEKEVRVLYRHEQKGGYSCIIDHAFYWRWGKQNNPRSEIIGWNYAE